MPPHFNARRWKPPNLAISSIAGNIEGHNVYIADLILRRDRVAETVRELISKYQPDVVGLTAMSFQFATARKIASLIKGLNKNIKIVLGVYHATVMYDEVCKGNEADPFDFFVRGEGDLCFNELLEAINGKKPIRMFSAIMIRLRNTR